MIVTGQQETCEEDRFTRLRRIYGADAVFTTAGLFTLIHLDGADPHTIKGRTRTFDIRTYEDPDCALCRYQREQGGIFVFAAPQPGEEAREEEADGESRAEVRALSALAEKLASALDRHDASADELISALEPRASAELLQLAVDDVGWLHDRLFDLAWSEERASWDASLKHAFETAHSSLETLAIAHPELGDPCTRTGDALEAVRRAFAGD